MQQLINEITEYSIVNADKQEAVMIEELYDKYASAVYGRILAVVKQKEIAEKILEKVFVTALSNTNTNARYVTPLTKLLNHTRRKTFSTLKAIRMLQACNCGYEGANPILLKADAININALNAPLSVHFKSTDT